jgi:hypothetical protein
LPPFTHITDHYFAVHKSDSTMPVEIANAVFPQMERAAKRALSASN